MSAKSIVGALTLVFTFTMTSYAVQSPVDAEDQLVCTPLDAGMNELLVRYRQIGDHRTFTFRENGEWTGQLCANTFSDDGEITTYQCTITEDEVRVEVRNQNGEWRDAFILYRQFNELERFEPEIANYRCERYP